MRMVLVLVCTVGWILAGCGRKAHSPATPAASLTNAVQARAPSPTDTLVPDTLPELQAAAERGDARAQQQLGHAYGEGRLVPPDGAQALKWSRLAAEQGNVQAQLQVGFCFAQGKFRALPLVTSRAVKLGAAVFTIGFPNPDWQGLSPKLTKGDISSLAGMRDDPRQFQVSVATQPGNSGGPLLDERGNVVGVLAMQANEALILRVTGTLPQNVNYAVKSAYALALLESLPELAAKLKAPHPKPRPLEDAVAEAEAAAALILVY